MRTAPKTTTTPTIKTIPCQSTSNVIPINQENHIRHGMTATTTPSNSEEDDDTELWESLQVHNVTIDNNQKKKNHVPTTTKTTIISSNTSIPSSPTPLPQPDDWVGFVTFCSILVNEMN